MPLMMGEGGEILGGNPLYNFIDPGKNKREKRIRVQDFSGQKKGKSIPGPGRKRRVNQTTNCFGPRFKVKGKTPINSRKEEGKR